MPLTQLAKPRWQAYFDRVSKALGAKRMLIEVTGLGLGDQVEAEWIPVLGLSYDPKDDVLVVAGEGLKHLIRHPRQIHVEQELDSLQSIEAIDGEGNHHIALLKDPLSLPPA
jgi:hypothetical protein